MTQKTAALIAVLGLFVLFSAGTALAWHDLEIEYDDGELEIEYEGHGIDYEYEGSVGGFLRSVCHYSYCYRSYGSANYYVPRYPTRSYNYYTYYVPQQQYRVPYYTPSISYYPSPYTYRGYYYVGSPYYSGPVVVYS
ncbi:MAG: hypothetical protein JW772_04115 [Candidatus Diapherotrites archaeon]|nr:hypothetical protein [Candidatus Diapherotrites archaeon]